MYKQIVITYVPDYLAINPKHPRLKVTQEVPFETNMLSSQEATDPQFTISQHEESTVSNSEGHSSLNEEESKSQTVIAKHFSCAHHYSNAEMILYYISHQL